MKNALWTKDELILALELYLRDRTSIGNKKHPEVLKLSEALNSLPSIIGYHKASNFRNPTGVAMKLSNFLRFDPSYKGKGLASGNKLEK
jgi:5-methylcytosine-specific restriction protein A